MIRFWEAAYVLTHRLAYIRFGTACICGGVGITGSTNLQLGAGGHFYTQNWSNYMVTLCVAGHISLSFYYNTL